MNFNLFNTKFTPRNFKTIIIDDEYHVRETLRTFLGKFCPYVQIIGEAGSVDESEKLIKQKHPDLVLLDIELDGGTAFDLLKRFVSPAFKVIFITAHNEFVLQAFKVSAIDFIPKPIDPQELAEAVNRALLMIHHEQKVKLDALESNLSSENRSKKKIVIKTQENIYLLEVGTIIYCQSDTVYTTIYTTENKSILTSKPIKDYEEMLLDFGFFRAHRSFLINLAHVKRFEKRDGGYIILSNNHDIPVATRKKEEMIALLKELSE